MAISVGAATVPQAGQIRYTQWRYVDLDCRKGVIVGGTEERSIQHLLSQLLKSRGLRREYIFSECASEASHSTIILVMSSTRSDSFVEFLVL
jgi:hypothetical protein